MAEPRVLLYDIETTHNIVASFRLSEEYTPHTNIIQERYIVAAAWRWLGEKKIHTVTTLDDPKRYARNPHDDFHVVKTLYDVIGEADVVVGHNSDQFDNKFVQTRGLVNGLGPLPPFTAIDTYKTAKAKFNFNSNRLDYLGKLLGFGGKKRTPEGLWLDVLKGDRKAIRIMSDYNKRDVELLEQVFRKLRPFMSNYVNRELHGGVGCPRCGSTKIQSRGIHRAISRIYRRWQCQSCAGWFRSTKNEPTSTKFRIL
jgi:hypothetical protein